VAATAARPIKLRRFIPIMTIVVLLMSAADEFRSVPLVASLLQAVLSCPGPEPQWQAFAGESLTIVAFTVALSLPTPRE
jgi:hypothetical protein